MAELKHKEITDKILRVFFKRVYHQLGYGFLEKVYEAAMELELQALGLDVVPQAQIDVYYNDHKIGEYLTDLLVENAVLVELKAVKRILPEHEAQLLNYLRATPYEVGRLLNFGPKPTFVRKAFDNANKPSVTWKQL